MSYADQTRRGRPASIAAVAILHGAIGYAFISGLAYRVISSVPVVTRADILPDDPPPPAHDLPPPRSRPTETQPARIDPIVTVPLTLGGDVRTVIVPPTPQQTTTIAPPPPPPPAGPNLTRDAAPIGQRGAWVTSEDYPTRALREGVAGVVGIAVLVGIDGRVTDCTVTASSGNAELDAATCRFYSRRARFAPARDADGRPVASHHADRIRWQVPQ